MVAFILRRTLLAAVVLMIAAAVVAGCDSDSSNPKPQVTADVTPTPLGPRATPAPRSEAEAIATYLQIKEDETPVSRQLTSIVFVDKDHGWALNDCEAFGEEEEICDLLATADGGDTWRVQHRNFGDLGTLLFLDGQTGFVIDNTESILRTADGGATWHALPIARTDAAIDGILFADAHTAFGLAAGVIFQLDVERDEGESSWWFNYGSPDCSFSSLSFPNPSEGWAAGAGPLGPCLFHSTDGGQTWQVSVAGIDAPPVRDAFLETFYRPGGVTSLETARSWIIDSCRRASVDFVSAGVGWMWVSCGSSYSGGLLVMRTLNSGRSWERAWGASSCLMGCQMATGGHGPLFFLNADYVWRQGRDSIERSSDGGKTWSPPAEEDGCCATLGRIFFVDADHGWATLDTEALAITKDGGRTWDRIPVTIVP